MRIPVIRFKNLDSLCGSYELNLESGPLAEAGRFAITGPIVTDESFANLGVGLDFTHTLSFPTTSPVADLPAGYTLEGLDVFVNNNRFGAVPEAETREAGLAVAGAES